ncbi:MAG: Transcriptional regulator HosA [Candidatus Celerinatantimonas neptuna]|nr:MAG: Transcriptional regulator HosA [Candidatus Celerinatantimonas neptuna]
MGSHLEQIAFHLIRQLFQEHTSLWQVSIPQLTKPQYSVIRAIAEQPGIEQIELMEASVTSKATLAEILARLEKRGLIYRQQGANDKRRRLVFLTNEGQSLLRSAIPLANQVDDYFLKRLKEQERSEFIRLLKTMIHTD